MLPVGPDVPPTVYTRYPYILLLLSTTISIIILFYYFQEMSNLYCMYAPPYNDTRIEHNSFNFSHTVSYPAPGILFEPTMQASAMALSDVYFKVSTLLDQYRMHHF